MSTSDDGTGPVQVPADPAWYEGVSGWQPLSRVFIDRELGKPEPNFRSLADRLAPYSAAERHAGWIGVAQSAPSRMGRTRAYVEALYNDPNPTSVAWSWLDGDFDLMERVEHVFSPDDAHIPATVEAVRNRVGSILDFGGNDMTPEQAGIDAASSAEPAQTAAIEEARPAAEPAAEESVAAATAVEESVAPASPPAPTPAPVPWSPTYFVPAGGVAAWDYPDPSRPPRLILSEGLALVVDGVAGEWALVRAVNGWRGWVDGRRLATRP